MGAGSITPHVVLPAGKPVKTAMGAGSIAPQVVLQTSKPVKISSRTT
jgi:hypothetical protein